jgi:hypothetical protein
MWSKSADWQFQPATSFSAHVDAVAVDSTDTPSASLQRWDRRNSCCDAEHGTPAAFPAAAPFCSMVTQGMHTGLNAPSMWAQGNARREALWAVAVALATAMVHYLSILTLPDSLESQPAPHVRRVLSWVLAATFGVFGAYIVAVWHHLVPNPHTARAARLGVHM